MEKIEKLNWKEFKLTDLFSIRTTKGIDRNKIHFMDNAPYEFIGRTSVGWGVQGYVEKLEYEPNPKDTFSLVQIGETVALWRSKEWYASQNIFLLQPKIAKIGKVFLFFQAAVNKEMSRYGNTYNSYPTLHSLNNTTIRLPATPEGSPDWDYMDAYISELEQERISELEQERISELDAYLKATGLDDYELTEEDREILASAVGGGQTHQVRCLEVALQNGQERLKNFVILELANCLISARHFHTK